MIAYVATAAAPDGLTALVVEQTLAAQAPDDAVRAARLAAASDENYENFTLSPNTFRDTVDYYLHAAVMGQDGVPLTRDSVELLQAFVEHILLALLKEARSRCPTKTFQAKVLHAVACEWHNDRPFIVPPADYARNFGW